MVPEAGQSFNPSAVAHKSVLSKVVGEETAEIETEKAKSLKHQIRVFNTKQQMMSDEEESEGESRSD